MVSSSHPLPPPYPAGRPNAAKRPAPCRTSSPAPAALPPAPALAESFSLTPPVDLTRLNPPPRIPSCTLAPLPPTRARRVLFSYPRVDLTRPNVPPPAAPLPLPPSSPSSCSRVRRLHPPARPPLYRSGSSPPPLTPTCTQQQNTSTPYRGQDVPPPRHLFTIPSRRARRLTPG